MRMFTSLSTHYKFDVLGDTIFYVDQSNSIINILYDDNVKTEDVDLL